jgi:hypothetical protein
VFVVGTGWIVLGLFVLMFLPLIGVHFRIPVWVIAAVAVLYLLVFYLNAGRLAYWPCPACGEPLSTRTNRLGFLVTSTADACLHCGHWRPDWDDRSPGTSRPPLRPHCRIPASAIRTRQALCSSSGRTSQGLSPCWPSGGFNSTGSTLTK